MGSGDERTPSVSWMGRSIVHALRFLLIRREGNMGKRVLMLIDSTIAILAFTRGRSSSAGMLCVC